MPKDMTLPNGVVVQDVPDNMTLGGLLDAMVQGGSVTALEAAEMLGQKQESVTSGGMEDFLVGAGEFFADRSFGLVDNSVRAPDTLSANLGRAAPLIIGSFALPGLGAKGVAAQGALGAGAEAIREGSSMSSITGQGALSAVGTGIGQLASSVVKGIGQAGANSIRQTLGTKFGSDFVRRVEAGISAGGGFDFLKRSAQKALNRSGAASIGEKATELTPKVLLRAATRIGKEFDRLLPDDKVFDLSATKAGLDELGTKITGKLRTLANNIDDAGQSSGGNLKNIRTTLQQKISALRGQNDDLADELSDVADALMSEIEDQITDPFAFRVAREQWKNLRLIEGLPNVRRFGNLTAGQANAAFARQSGYGTSFLRDTGTVLPATQNMFNQVRSMEVLAEIVGDSGTATRLAALAGIGATGGYLMEGDLEGASKGLALGLAPLALGRVDVALANRTLGAASPAAGRLGGALLREFGNEED